jgi:acid phosphatase
MRDSAEYAAVTIQTYRFATARVEQEAKTRAQGSWAVVVDADDTIINNLPYQVRLFTDGVRHTPERFTAWVRQQASSPVPGARQFLERVRSLGGRIAVVTNRLAIECDDTAAVLRKNGLVHDAVLCRPEGDAVIADKNPRFRQVALGQSSASTSSVDIVLYVGDNILDFPGGNQSMRAAGESAFSEFGVRWFQLPNPMYGSWQ